MKVGSRQTRDGDEWDPNLGAEPAVKDIVAAAQKRKDGGKEQAIQKCVRQNCDSQGETLG